MPKQLKYREIVNYLQAAIADSTFQAGEQLPSELDLAQQFKVSRITSKRALTELEQKGLVTRIQGKGSFVKQKTRTEPNLNTKNYLFVLPFPTDQGLGNYVGGMQTALAGNSQQVITINNQSFPQLIAKNELSQYAGIIYYPGDLQKEFDLVYQVVQDDIPIVLIDRTLPNLPVPVVLSDNFAGGRLATEHLIQAGHRQIDFVTRTAPNQMIPSVLARYFGYLAALKAANITTYTPLQDLGQQLDEQSNYLKTAQKHGVTGLVVENDLVAIRLMNRLRQQQIEVPEDLSIVGFDNIQAASLSYPPLTTVAQNFTAIGQQALELIQQQQLEPITHKVDVQLISRQSVKKIN